MRQDKEATMAGPTLNSLVERLDRLERANRWLKLLGILLLVGFVVAPSVGGPQDRTADVVTARRFVAVGPTGQRQAELGVDAEGQPSLALFDTPGRVRVRLLHSARQPSDAPALLLFDKDSKLRAFLALNAEGAPRVALRDADGVIRAVLGHTTIEWSGTRGTRKDEERGASSLVLFGKQGDVVWKAP